MQRPIASERGNGGTRVAPGSCGFDMRAKGAGSLVLVGVEAAGWAAGLPRRLELAGLQGCRPGPVHIDPERPGLPPDTRSWDHGPDLQVGLSVFT